MKCNKCSKEIPLERIEVFPNTRECVNCSSVKQKVSFMNYEHKTAGSIITVDGNNPEGVRQAKRAYRRAR